MNLFINEPFTSHAGLRMLWKIECDALSDIDIETIAALIARNIEFRAVRSVPRGGDRLARALEPYAYPTMRGAPYLVVDDVCTTGSAITAVMRQWRDELGEGPIQGIVLFARTALPSNVAAVFQLGHKFDDSDVLWKFRSA